MADLKDFKFIGDETKDADRLIRRGYDSDKAFRAAMEFANKYKGRLPKKEKKSDD